MTKEEALGLIAEALREFRSVDHVEVSATYSARSSHTTNGAVMGPKDAATTITITGTAKGATS